MNGNEPNPPSQDICRECRWWFPQNASRREDAAWGQCRRHAPTCTGRDIRWPYTHAEGWCGDFQQVKTGIDAGGDRA